MKTPLVKNTWLKFIVALFLFISLSVFLYNHFYKEFLATFRGSTEVIKGNYWIYAYTMVFLNLPTTLYAYNLVSRLEQPIDIDKNKFLNIYLLILLLLIMGLIINISFSSINIIYITILWIILVATLTKNKNIMMQKITNLKYIIGIFILFIITNKNILEYIIHLITKDNYHITTTIIYAPFPVWNTLNNNYGMIWWGILFSMILWISIYFDTIFSWYDKNKKSL